MLHLNSQVSGEPLMKLSQEEVNAMADIYLETHQESLYEEYIRNYIRYQYAPSDRSLGMDFSAGYGILTGELSQMYNNLGILGFGLDVEYKKFTLFLRANAGFAKTLQDRENNGVYWEKGSESSFFIPDASIGYAVLENDKLKLSPYVGIGGASIEPTTTDKEERPDLKELKVGFSPAYTVGLNVNIKLGWETAPYWTVVEDKSYWLIKLRYGYSMPQFDNYPLHSGNVHHVTIGFGGMYRGMKRVI